MSLSLLRAFILTQLLCALDGVSVGDAVSLELEASWGGAFSARCSTSFSAVQAASGSLRWKPNATTAGTVSAADILDFKTFGDQGYYRVRARHPSGAWVFGSVRVVSA